MKIFFNRYILQKRQQAKGGQPHKWDKWKGQLGNTKEEEEDKSMEKGGLSLNSSVSAPMSICLYIHIISWQISDIHENRTAQWFPIYPSPGSHANNILPYFLHIFFIYLFFTIILKQIPDISQILQYLSLKKARTFFVIPNCNSSNNSIISFYT